MRQALSVLAPRFTRAGLPLYLVGGSVRNPLLGLPCSDLDVCSPATVEEAADILRDAPVTVTPRARFLGTLQLQWDFQGQSYFAEYTSFRSDAYRSGHVPSAVTFTRDMGVDALRRDFRVNAIYRDADRWTLADPLGGLGDLSRRLLRAVSDDPYEVLKDDGLRILRMIRFAGQLGFAIDPALWAEAKRQIGRLGEITPERQMEEWRKILLCDRAYPTLPSPVPRLEKALSQLLEVGAFPFLLPGTQITPEDIERVSRLSSAFCTFALSTGVVGERWMPPAFTEDGLLALRLAALLLRTPPRVVQERLLFLRFSTALVHNVVALLTILRSPVVGDPRPRVAGLGPGRTAQLILLLEVLDRPQEAAALRAGLSALQRAQSPEKTHELSLSSRELLGLLGGLPARCMTPLLEELWRHVLLFPGDDTPDDLRARAREWVVQAQALEDRSGS